MGGEVAVSRWDAEQESIIVHDVLDRDKGVVRLGGSVHLGEDLIGEGLGDAVEVDGTAGLTDALGLSLGEGLDVTPGGVLEMVLVLSRG